MASKELEAKNDHYCSILDSLIAKVVRATQVDAADGATGAGGDAKTKSMVQIKQEAKERARWFDFMKIECN